MTSKIKFHGNQKLLHELLQIQFECSFEIPILIKRTKNLRKRNCFLFKPCKMYQESKIQAQNPVYKDCNYLDEEERKTIQYL